MLKERDLNFVGFVWAGEERYTAKLVVPKEALKMKLVQNVFRLTATVSRISLMESCTCHHCHWCGYGTPPPAGL